ncbi:YheC/YheD family protein [Lederbergia citrea]|uniref:YheC/YheD family protein n=1 Tax=Lederbergia citrea TaxID=2833581 RepID=A0A942Z467_9BACI|nr:YheC/YheD family protein [Lederbergia citrea]MBS4222075.1 YheC/YheD family protein [Lederbergia citrea]
MDCPYIGILVDGLVYSGFKKGYTYFECLPYYEEAGRNNHFIPCYFRLKDINPGNSTITAYVLGEGNNYDLQVIPKPTIIHNRGLFFTKMARSKIASLQKEGIILFNSWNRYEKLQVHELLTKKSSLRSYLPETVKASKDHMEEMMSKHDELIIKPSSGSLGNSIIKVAKVSNENWEIIFQKNKSLVKESFANIKWPEKLITIVSNPRYIIQQRIPLATYQASPFDLRVSVQRNGIGEWQVSGIVGKVAQKGMYVTNLAKGGTSRPLSVLLQDLPHLNLEDVSTTIKNFSIEIAEQLGEHIPYLADIGLDIGITNEGFPMFIECNARDLRITFRNANMMDEWKATHITPLNYAIFLMKNNQKHKEGEQ